MEGSLLSLAAASDASHDSLHAPVVLSCADSMTLQPLSFVGVDSPIALLAVRNTSDHSSATLPPTASLADPVRGSVQLINTLLVYLLAFAPRSFPLRREPSSRTITIGLGAESAAESPMSAGSSSAFESQSSVFDAGTVVPPSSEPVVACSPTVAMVCHQFCFVFLVDISPSNGLKSIPIQCVFCNVSRRKMCWH
jgi:hypothetical protein